MRLEQGLLAIRELRREDAPFLCKWLTDPRVLEFYEGRDNPATPESIRADFYAADDVSRCIVEWEGAPVGYVQFYRLEEAGCAEYQYPYHGQTVYGIDQFIGEPACWNRKIGRAFLKRLLEFLTGERGADAVILDPHADNLRAIRCYESCGFQAVKLLPRHERHEGALRDCWLMEYHCPK